MTATDTCSLSMSICTVHLFSSSLLYNCTHSLSLSCIWSHFSPPSGHRVSGSPDPGSTHFWDSYHWSAASVIRSGTLDFQNRKMSTRVEPRSRTNTKIRFTSGPAKPSRTNPCPKCEDQWVIANSLSTPVAELPVPRRRCNRVVGGSRNHLNHLYEILLVQSGWAGPPSTLKCSTRLNAAARSRMHIVRRFLVHL